MTLSHAALGAAAEVTDGARYAELASAYGRHLDERLGTRTTLTKKWQHEDLVWPHSDIDLRVILGDPPSDWFSFSHTLATVHRELVTVDPSHRRLLEHPPGWVYLRAEVHAHLVPPAELVSWSLCHPGESPALAEWTQHAAAAPWTPADDRLYHGILASCIHGAYKLDLDSPDNVILDRAGYPVHCVAWHYLAPVVFAAASLGSRRRHRGKMDALHDHQVPAVRQFLALVRDGYRSAPSPEVLLRWTHRVVDTLAISRARLVPASPPLWTELVSAVGVLRCRPSRYAYYLDPPTGVVTGYLIDRETKDLYAAVRTLQAGIAMLPTEIQVLARRFLALVPPPPTTRDALQRFVDGLVRHASLVNEFFSVDLTKLCATHNGNGRLE